MKLVLATGNANKVREMKPLLPQDWEVLSLKDLRFEGDLQEDHDNIEDNSLQKARFVWEQYGLPCIAEDTGLFVDALGGEPGVDTAHYAGPQRSNDDNIRLLLKNMEGQTGRSAHFKTVMTLMINGVAHQFEGVLNGKIALAPSGNQGFGYDPIFEIGEGVSLASIPAEVKREISHRSKALKKLLDLLLQMQY